MGTTNKLLHTALRKWTHSSRQAEAAVIVTYHHIVGENGLGLNRPISNDLDGMEYNVLWAEQYDKSDTDSKEEGENVYDEMVTHEQLQQMFSGESDDDEFWGF